MPTQPTNSGNWLGRILLYVLCSIAFFAVLLSYTFEMRPDNISRPLIQTMWFVVFMFAASILLLTRKCGGPSWLAIGFFISQIACIFLAILSGCWWFSHSQLTGRPILFANALLSLCCTYPFMEWFFVTIRKCVETNDIPATALFPFLLCMVTLLPSFSVVAFRYADPEANVYKQILSLEHGEYLRTEARAKENAYEREQRRQRTLWNSSGLNGSDHAKYLSDWRQGGYENEESDQQQAENRAEKWAKRQQELKEKWRLGGYK